MANLSRQPMRRLVLFLIKMLITRSDVEDRCLGRLLNFFICCGSQEGIEFAYNKQQQVRRNINQHSMILQASFKERGTSATGAVFPDWQKMR